MRFIYLGVFVFLFVATPVYLLNALVMPDLTALKQTYAHADATANSVVAAR